jgi:predicted AAA+ superfamily ATPase
MPKDLSPDELAATLSRIAAALERLAPAPLPACDLDAAGAFIWSAQARRLDPVAKVNRVEIGLLRGIDQTRDILIDNTRRFARGLPANNALLWGARGMGKSSLVKAAHHLVNEESGGKLKLVEIHREERTSKACRSS